MLDRVKVLRDREYGFGREVIHRRRRGVRCINRVEGCVEERIVYARTSIFQKGELCRLVRAFQALSGGGGSMCMGSTRKKGLEEGMGVREKGEEREDARRQEQG